MGFNDAKDMYRSDWTDETRCSLKEVTLDISSGRISIRMELRWEGGDDRNGFAFPTT